MLSFPWKTVFMQSFLRVTFYSVLSGLCNIFRKDARSLANTPSHKFCSNRSDIVGSDIEVDAKRESDIGSQDNALFKRFLLAGPHPKQR